MLPFQHWNSWCPCHLGVAYARSLTTVRPMTSRFSRSRACAAAVLAVIGVTACGGSRPTSHGSDPARAAVYAAVPAPGGAVQSGAVAYVGSTVISKSALESRMAIEARQEPPPENIVPVPPRFTACIAHLRAAAAKSRATAASEGQLKSRCEGLYLRLLYNGMQPLIATAWVIGGAREEGLTASDQQIRSGLERDLARQFGSEAKFQKYLRQTNENIPDLLYTEELLILSEAIRHKIAEATPPVTAAQVARYYAENKQQFAIAEKRNIEIIRASSAAAARQIKREIQRGTSFAAVAKRLASVRLSYAPNGALDGLEPHTYQEKLPQQRHLYDKAGSGGRAGEGGRAARLG